MKTVAEIRAEIKKLKSDDRYPRKQKDIAMVHINAPLALIQVDLKAKINALQWVLRSKADEEIF